MLGALRDDEHAPLAPQPTLAALDALIAQLRGAGLHVEVDIAGAPTPCRRASIERPIGSSRSRSPTSCATAARRAPGSRSATGPDRLELTVCDTGTSVATAAAEGRGIAGMRERAVSLGGTLDAGPDAGGGFVVRARLPLPGTLG